MKKIQKTLQAKKANQKRVKRRKTGEKAASNHTKSQALYRQKTHKKAPQPPKSLFKREVEENFSLYKREVTFPL
ncbi:MAG: hypothetical protein SOY48_08075, partial [Eubacterium sp.]|nr:hypothetical protein [Eubacterium sp.]